MNREYANKDPDCVKCGWVSVHDANMDFIFLVNKYRLLLFDGEGNVSTEGFKYVIDYEGIDDIDTFLLKLSIYISMRGKK